MTDQIRLFVLNSVVLTPKRKFCYGVTPAPSKLTRITMNISNKMARHAFIKLQKVKHTEGEEKNVVSMTQ